MRSEKPSKLLNSRKFYFVAWSRIIFKGNPVFSGQWDQVWTKLNIFGFALYELQDALLEEGAGVGGGRVGILFEVILILTFDSHLDL